MVTKDKQPPSALLCAPPCPLHTPLCPTTTYVFRWLQWQIQDFPKEGAPTPHGGCQHTILPKFPKNCMKLKEFGPPRGACIPCAPLDLLLGCTVRFPTTTHMVMQLCSKIPHHHLYGYAVRFPTTNYVVMR